MAKSYPPFADIHCHPAIKPFGKSFDKNINSPKPRKKISIWHRNRAGVFARLFNRVSTLTRFTQADFTTLTKGNVKVICASLSPIEKGFFVSTLGKDGKGPVTDIIAQLVTRIGIKKINFIQDNKDYFSELEGEMDFYVQLNNKDVKVRRKKWKYTLVQNFMDVRQNLETENRTISVILTIEGFHALNKDNTKAPDANTLVNNISTIKNWQYRPLFISPAHHFNNFVCGHAFSLSEKLQELISQSDGANTGITDLGKEAIRQCLSNSLQNRIYIDIKHMSRKSRRDFYEMLDSGEFGNVPVIVSHAAVNGYSSVDTDSDLDPDNGLFNGGDVNIFNDEIVRIGASDGLFGIQLDERRIASSEEKRNARSIFYRKGLKRRSKLVWNQIEHIAKLLDNQNLPAWNCQVIGSDFDGMVDPINGFWTAKEYRSLYQFLLNHAKTFTGTYNFHRLDNKIDAKELINKVFSGNLMSFLKKWYN